MPEQERNTLIATIKIKKENYSIHYLEKLTDEEFKTIKTHTYYTRGNVSHL